MSDIHFYTAKGKRLFDLALVIPALVLLTPVAAVVALLVWLRLGAPVLFKQRRSGLNMAPFTLIKFRTMTNSRDHLGRLLPDAARITPFGQALRRTGLDELPELINVLRGEMSLVGPRPLPLRYLDRYSSAQSRRHDVRPGLTGWAQVNGRNTITWKRRFAMDLWYIGHQSLWLDVKILALTLRLLLRRGASAGEPIMPEFQGSAEP